MKILLTGVSILNGEPIRYYMIEETTKKDADSYGIMVEFKGEQTKVRKLSSSEKEIQVLLEQMRKGIVTPVSVPDVAEDWLVGNRI